MRSKIYEGKKMAKYSLQHKRFFQFSNDCSKEEEIHSVEDIKITYIKLNWLSKRLITGELLHLDNFVNEINANRNTKIAIQTKW